MATDHPLTPQPAQGGAVVEAEIGAGIAAPTGGLSPWQLAWRRLRRNKVSLAFGVVFVLLVALALAAPLWADHVAKTTPEKNHISDVIRVGGEEKQVVNLEGVPIGPTWQKKFFLGA